MHTDTALFPKAAVPTIHHSQSGPLHGKVGTRASVSPAPCVCRESKALGLGCLHAGGAHNHCEVRGQ